MNNWLKFVSEINLYFKLKVVQARLIESEKKAQSAADKFNDEKRHLQKKIQSYQKRIKVSD